MTSAASLRGENSQSKRVGNCDSGMREMVVEKIKQDRYLNSLFRYDQSAVILSTQEDSQKQDKANPRENSGSTSVLGKYSLSKSFVNRRKSKHTSSSGYATPLQESMKNSVTRQDSVAEGYSRYVFVPFNRKLSEDKAIKARIEEQIAVERAEKLEAEKAENSSQKGLNTQTRTNIKLPKWVKTRNVLQNKTKQSLGPTAGTNKLLKANSSINMMPMLNSSLLQLDAGFYSDDYEDRGEFRVDLPKSFIIKQLNSSMKDLTMYKEEIKNRMGRLKRDLSEKIRSSNRMEACLAKYTLKIPKEKIQLPTASDNGSVDVKGMEELSAPKPYDSKQNRRDSFEGTEVLSYECHLHKVNFLNVYPIARSSPMMAVYSMEVANSSVNENRLICFGGLGLNLMDDCYYLNLDKMKWFPMVGQF